MNKVIKVFLLLFLFINVFFAAWYLLHGDIFFHTDIARDFLLLDELQLKKFVLIGPRASGLTGFFHGPLWMYINFPVYLISKGDPLAQGWFWFGLLILYLGGTYSLWKKRIGSDRALIFITLLSLFFTIDPDRGFANGFYNPFGALLLMPFFMYFFHSYWIEKKAWQLILLLFINGLIIQFQVAFGAPLLILASLLIIWRIIISNKFTHFISYIILLVPASTYILFDFRHNFSHFKAIFMAPFNPYIEKLDFLTMLMQRSEMILYSGLHFFREPFIQLNVILTIAFSFIIYFIFINKKDRLFLFLFIYFFLGYFILSLFHNGWLMYFYWMQIYPITFLFFAHSNDVIKKGVYYPVLFFVIIINTLFNFANLNKSNSFIGLAQSSWKFQSSMVETIFKDKDTKNKEFGFFIYAPDIFGYSSKYPFIYFQKRYPNSKMATYEKKSLTYIVVEPPPKQQPRFIPDWWITNKLHISTGAAEIKLFDNGFKILKYKLKGDDLTTEIEPGVKDWVYFR